MAEVSLELIFEHQKRMMALLSDIHGRIHGLRGGTGGLLGSLDRIDQHLDSLLEEVRAFRQDIRADLEHRPEEGSEGAGDKDGR